MRLSQILTQLQDAQQYPLYRKVKAAIRDGELLAVPLAEPLTIPRANKPLTVLDHFMLTEPGELQQWLEGAIQPEKRATGAARYAVKDPSALTPEELRRKAEEYRASLSKSKPKRKAK